MDVIQHPFRTLILGGSESGKTTFILNMLLRRDLYGGYFDQIYVLTGEGRNNSAINRIPKAKYCEYSDEMIGLILEKHPVKERGVIVFDDPAGTNIQYAGRSTSNFQRIWSGVGRHKNLSLLLSAQKMTMYPPLLRLNVSTIIMFDLGNQKQMDLFWSEFCSCDLRVFRQFYRSYFREKYKFLLWHKSGAQWVIRQGLDGHSIRL